MQNTKYRIVFLALIFTAILAPQAALAYGGPTLGLSAVGSLLALVGAILAAIVGFIWYPIKRLIRYLRRSRRPRDNQ